MTARRGELLATHVPLKKVAGMPPEEQGPYFAGIHARMRENLEALLPEWTANVVHVMTASPRTFQRFTLRDAGAVGGVRTAASIAAVR